MYVKNVEFLEYVILYITVSFGHLLEGKKLIFKVSHRIHSQHGMWYMVSEILFLRIMMVQVRDHLVMRDLRVVYIYAYMDG